MGSQRYKNMIDWYNGTCYKAISKVIARCVGGTGVGLHVMVN